MYAPMTCGAPVDRLIGSHRIYRSLANRVQHRGICNVVWQLIRSALVVRVSPVRLFIIRYLRIVDFYVKIALLAQLAGIACFDHLLYCFLICGI